MKTPANTPSAHLSSAAIVAGLAGGYALVANLWLPTWEIPPAVTVAGLAVCAALIAAGVRGIVRMNRELRAWVAGDHPVAQRQLAEHAGPVLVHWSYAPDEWAAYVARERALGKSDRRTTVIAVVGMMAIMAAMGGVALWAVPVIVLGIWGWTAFFFRDTEGMTRQLDPGDALPSATLTARAVVFHGRRLFLEDAYSSIRRVRYEDGEAPRVVVGVLVRGRTHMMHEIRIPVPRGHEEEARAVAAAFPRPARPVAPVA